MFAGGKMEWEDDKTGEGGGEDKDPWTEILIANFDGTLDTEEYTVVLNASNVL